MTIAHDLLDEPLLSWRDRQRHRGKTTLPGMIAKLSSGELADFPRARAHQFHPWSMFLTQLAAMALHRAGKSNPRLSEKDWRSLLLDLTDAAHEPWCLVVEDLSKAAFFQPPVPREAIEAWKGADHPDDLDILVTSKSHDVKSSIVRGDDIEAWAFALVTLQTMQGYSGGKGGYNGIARMKGGYGSRPRVGLAPNHSLSDRFARDIQVLLHSWDALLTRGFNDDGIALGWLAPWDGESSLTMSDLSPHFVEVCRRLRLQILPPGMRCAYTTSRGRRCLPEIENGDAGDPWVPVEREGGALTVGGGGFRYQLLTKLLFESGYEPAAAQVIRPGDSDPLLFLASVMARGQGKTEGLHERELLVTGAARKRLGQTDTRAAFGVRAAHNVEQAKKMRSNVLFPALKKVALGETVPQDEFDARVDEVFFDELFASLEQGDDEARLEWDCRLNEMAWAELQRAIDRCCVPSARWYQAVSNAEGVFRACRSKQFPTLVASFEPGGPRGAAQ